MKTLAEQQAKAWSMALRDAKCIAQDENGDFCSYESIARIDCHQWTGMFPVCLFQGEINGWDWRDTLQTREEYEAMKKQNTDEKWVPEVGQKCLIAPKFDPEGIEWFEIYVEHVTRQVVLGRTKDNFEEAFHFDSYQFRPIQSPADKYRAEQIELLMLASDSLQPTAPWYDPITKDRAKLLFNNGARVLRKGEAVGKRLTDKEIEDAASEEAEGFVYGAVWARDKIFWEGA